LSPKASLENEFTARIQQCQGILNSVCNMYCRDPEHKKDLLQEIMIQLWRSYPSFRGEAKFSSWVYRVALNVAIQDIRKVKKQKLLFFQSYEIPDDQVWVEENTGNEKSESLRRAITKLNKVEKAIIMLHLDENPNEEIAEIMGISQNYVRVHMTRIRKKLSEIMNN